MSGLQPYIGKKYKLESSDKFDEHMKLLGVSDELRKIGNALVPIVQILENNGVYTIRIDTTKRVSDTVFKLGEEFEDKTPDGRVVKTIITVDGNKLIQEQKGVKAETVVRTFSDKEMVSVYTVGDHVCTRKFKLVE